MKAFPMFIRTTDRRVVIVGGGEQAAQKARLMLKTDAQIVLVAPELDEELTALVEEGRATQETTLSAASFDAAAMAFIATGCPGFDGAAQALARAARCPVNVVDRPDLCDITTPAIVDRDPIVVAIGSEGTSPILTREIKTQLETLLPPRMGALAALAGRLRPAVARAIPHHQRRAFWGWVFRGAPRAAWNRGAEREAATAIKQALAEGRAPETDRAGLLSLIDAGAGQSDLMTLRAVARLQEADVIFLSGELPQDLLELARRDAERVILPAPGTGTAFPLDGFEPALLAEARAGRRVVRLCGAADYAHLSCLPAPSGCDLERIPGVALAEAPDNLARTPGRAAPLR